MRVTALCLLALIVAPALAVTSKASIKAQVAEMEGLLKSLKTEMHSARAAHASMDGELGAAREARRVRFAEKAATVKAAAKAAAKAKGVDDVPKTGTVAAGSTFTQKSRAKETGVTGYTSYSRMYHDMGLPYGGLGFAPPPHITRGGYSGMGTGLHFGPIAPYGFPIPNGDRSKLPDDRLIGPHKLGLRGLPFHPFSPNHAMGGTLLAGGPSLLFPFGGLPHPYPYASMGVGFGGLGIMGLGFGAGWSSMHPLANGTWVPAGTVGPHFGHPHPSMFGHPDFAGVQPYMNGFGAWKPGFASPLLAHYGIAYPNPGLDRYAAVSGGVEPQVAFNALDAEGDDVPGVES